MVIVRQGEQLSRRLGAAGLKNTRTQRKVAEANKPKIQLKRGDKVIKELPVELQTYFDKGYEYNPDTNSLEFKEEKKWEYDKDFGTRTQPVVTSRIILNEQGRAVREDVFDVQLKNQSSSGAWAFWRPEKVKTIDLKTGQSSKINLPKVETFLQTQQKVESEQRRLGITPKTNVKVFDKDFSQAILDPTTGKYRPAYEFKQTTRGDLIIPGTEDTKQKIILGSKTRELIDEAVGVRKPIKRLETKRVDVFTPLLGGSVDVQPTREVVEPVTPVFRDNNIVGYVDNVNKKSFNVSKDSGLVQRNVVQDLRLKDIEKDRVILNSLKDSNPEQYNKLLVSFNEKVNNYNDELESLKPLLDSQNKDLEDYNKKLENYKSTYFDVSTTEEGAEVLTPKKDLLFITNPVTINKIRKEEKELLALKEDYDNKYFGVPKLSEEQKVLNSFKDKTSAANS